MRWITWVTIVAFTVGPILAGCADKEMQHKYYDVELQRSQMLADVVQQQAQANQTLRVSQMTAFSSAASAAAMTEDNVDDAMIAMAWGYQLGQPMTIEIPKLQPLKAPETNADLVRAWTPIVGMAMPFLYPLAYGWASGSGGTKYSTGDGGTIAVQSGNAGSYNTAQGDMATTITNQGNLGINNSQDNCAGEECEDEVGGLTPDDIETCETDPPGGFSPSGTPLLCEGCSCGSAAAGECACPELF